MLLVIAFIPLKKTSMKYKKCTCFNSECPNTWLIDDCTQQAQLLAFTVKIDNNINFHKIKCEAGTATLP
jgi:hypothetical protein